MSIPLSPRAANLKQVVAETVLENRVLNPKVQHSMVRQMGKRINPRR